MMYSDKIERYSCWRRNSVNAAAIMCGLLDCKMKRNIQEILLKMRFIPIIITI